jgi:tetratricopeptide (TPR) repeat protein
MKNLLFLQLLILLWACDTPQVKRDRFFLQGNLAMEQKEYKKAIDFYEKALFLDADFSFAHNNLGVALAEDNRYFEAIQSYNQAILINPQYWESIQNRAYAYEKTGKYEKALNDYEQLTNAFPDSAVFHFGKGLMQTQLKNFLQAHDAFSVVLQLQPKNLDAKINQANLLFFDGKLTEAKSALKGITNQDKSHAMAFNSLNQVLLALGEFEAALVAINQALDIEPGNPVFLNNRGYTLIKNNQLELAISDINQSIVIDPDNKWAYRNKGIYFIEMGDCKQAKRYLLEAKKSNSVVDSVDFYLKKCN